MGCEMTSAGRPVLHGLHVVLVDDAAGTRRLLSEVLKAFGVSEIDAAGDAYAALELISAKHPDLVLCDWHMPAMDGIAFLRTLRRKEFGQAGTVPVIMLTAHSQPELVQAAMDAGANHFVTKPIVPADLLSRIVWVLEDTRSFVLSGDRYVLAQRDGARPPHRPVWLVE